MFNASYPFITLVTLTYFVSLALSYDYLFLKEASEGCYL